MVTKYVYIERHLPDALKRKPPAVWSKPGGPQVTGDFIERGDVNEAGLRVCTAQVGKIIDWDKPSK
ncbi:MAG: hypothetical protein E5V66_14170 [Mesorhizobium sp.]|uniref:hypothetical protein n=1 Tax=Mesorhizobium sp. TaxID=1871066 RepID=UPI001204B6AF|nr:hypothetical protein [Mesorhizobium sp.]TIW11306.1 MAG: hypothetical protein E5V66_14170 [Mesorhizobium sp.]